VGALVRGAGGIGLIDLPAQFPIVGVGHHRQVGGEIQGQQPTAVQGCTRVAGGGMLGAIVLLPLGGSLLRQRQDRFRQPRQF
jgi:hypothetical protein